MWTPFEKWEGCGNDFLVFEVNPHDDLIIDSLKQQARGLCDRSGKGVGADGLVVMKRLRADAAFGEKLTIINSDGSLAATCGNALRCASMKAWHNVFDSKSPPATFELAHFQLDDMEVDCRFLAASERSVPHSVAVELGYPVLNEASPLFAQMEATRQLLTTLGPWRNLDLHFVSGINPHLVLFTQDQDAMDEMADVIGPAMQKVAAWDGINVHIAAEVDISSEDQARCLQQLGNRMGGLAKVMTWERGAGRTQACGSGASAAAACLYAQGFIETNSWIGIDMPGGRVFISWADKNGPITLAGPANLVFRGEIDL